MIHNIGQRIEQEIRKISPAGAEVHVFTPTDTHEAWRGASEFARSEEFLKCSMTRGDYHECGAFLSSHRHFASNG